MRLLKAASINSASGLELVDSSPDAAEVYAILSHTWTADEVIYEDLANGNAPSRGAYLKVVYACKQALRDGYDYIWIDTCCIDKRSSAELSESINSMYAWYQQAAVCYAYLADYADDGGHLAQCRWFTRGFTLQELIAPRHVIFYSAGWTHIGDKHGMSREISLITRIAPEILTGSRSVETTSIANRMGWAAHRVTTRPEDTAYCLMGIFSVNMPLLYGEGNRAFTRLQEEIMKASTDHTLFVWMDENAPDDREYGLLAAAPRCFEKTHMLIPYPIQGSPRPYSMTNEGLSIELPIHRSVDRDHSICMASLNCPPPDYENSTFVAVYLRGRSGGLGVPDQRFARVRAGKLGRIRTVSNQSMEDTRPDATHIYVGSGPRKSPVETVFPRHFVRLWKPPSSSLYRLADMQWHHKEPKAQSLPQGGWADIPVVRRAGHVIMSMLFVRRQDGERLVLTIGSLDVARLGFSAVEAERKRRGKKMENLPPVPDTDHALFLTPLGQAIELPHHIATVRATTEARGIAKFYQLEIGVEPKAIVINPPKVPEASMMAGSAESSRTRSEQESSSRRNGAEGPISRWRRLLPGS